MRWRVVLIAATIAVALMPMSADLVERLYSRGGFPIVQTAMTSMSNLVPFALFDVLVLTAIVLWLWLLVRDVKSRRKNGWPRTLGAILLRTTTILAGAYLAFLLLWGLNYRRTPLTGLLDFDRRRISPAAARALLDRTIAELNALHADAHRDGWPRANTIDRRLVDAFWAAQRDLGVSSRIVPARPKRTMFDPYFTRAAVAGMTDPYFLETMVASDLLPFERPAVIAHEWGHLAGFVDEGDANFVSWLACLHGAPSHQYSGWLSLYGDLGSSVGRDVWRDANAKLAAGPRADIKAIRDRYETHVNPVVSDAGWRVYDQYLKANRVDEGTRSYAQVVTLVLGTAFAPDGAPRLRLKH
jgi:hypothetical protein